MKCEECRKQVRHKKIKRFASLWLCWNCYRRKVHIIHVGQTQSKLTLKQALDKTYDLHAYLDKNRGLVVTRSFPSILAGHKVKLLIVE